MISLPPGFRKDTHTSIALSRYSIGSQSITAISNLRSSTISQTAPISLPFFARKTLHLSNVTCLLTASNHSPSVSTAVTYHALCAHQIFEAPNPISSTVLSLNAHVTSSSRKDLVYQGNTKPFDGSRCCHSLQWLRSIIVFALTVRIITPT